MTELEAKAKDCIENHTHKLVDKPTKQDIYLREESIFISGYRLGATENGIQWHDLRKDPNELPKDSHTVQDEDGERFFYFRGKFYYENDNFYNCKPSLWCEIPQFEE